MNQIALRYAAATTLKTRCFKSVAQLEAVVDYARMLAVKLLYRITFSLLLFGCVSAYSFAADSFVIDEASSAHRINQGIEYIEDPSGKLTIDEVSHTPLGWKQVTSVFPNFGFTSSYYWLRIKVLNTSFRNSKYRLQLEYPLMDELNFYFADFSGKYLKIEAGDSLPFRKRLIKDRMFTFDISLQRGVEQTYYLRIKSTDTLIAPLVVYTLAQYDDAQRIDSFFFGMYYGSIVIILIYNSFLFIFLRDKSQFFYVCLIGFYAVMELSLNGSGNVYLWGDYPVFAKHIRPIMLGLLTISTLYVTKTFLNIDRLQWRKINFEWILWGVGIASIISSFILPFSASIQLAMAGTAISCPVVYITGIYFWRRGRSTAKYFTLGWSGLLIGGIVNVLRAFDVLPVNFWTTYGSQIGSVMTLLTLNMALTDRMRALQWDKDKAQQVIIEKQEEANRLLDSKVQERTLALQRKSEEAERARELSEAATKAKSQFLATMSHEIRTPMNGVIGMTQLLEDTQLNSQQIHYLRTIKNSGEALLRIINDILDYSKIEAGKLDIEYIEFSLRSLIDECVSLFSIRATSVETRFICHVAENVPERIIGDPTRIRQIIINLLSNAFKFTQQGSIVLQVYKQAQDVVGFCVEDSGIGLSLPQQEKLFEPFSQADSTTTRKYGGTGLGLAICKLLVELMGGKISVESQQGNGAKFFFSIKANFVSSPRAVDGVKSKRILIADPDKAFVQSIADLLTAWGAIPLFYPETNQAENIDAVIYSEFLDYSDQEILSARKLPKVKVLKTASSAYSEDEIGIETPLVPGRLRLALTRLFDVAEQQEMTVIQRTHDFSRIRVLVAEDNEVNRLVIIGMLKKFGIVPTIAVDGIEVIAKFEQSTKPYHLILMDCEMPNLDGYEATQRITTLQKNNPNPTKIFGLSAHALAEYRDKGLALGMSGFLTKPVKLKDLEDLFRQFTD